MKVGDLVWVPRQDLFDFLDEGEYHLAIVLKFFSLKTWGNKQEYVRIRILDPHPADEHLFQTWILDKLVDIQKELAYWEK